MPDDRVQLLPDDHRIEEGAWQKPVAQPKAEVRPAGLLHKPAPLPSAGVGKDLK